MFASSDVVTFFLPIILFDYEFCSYICGERILVLCSICFFLFNQYYFFWLFVMFTLCFCLCHRDFYASCKNTQEIESKILCLPVSGVRHISHDPFSVILKMLSQYSEQSCPDII